MATATTSLRVYKPASGDTGWDSAVNTDFDIIDAAIGGFLSVPATNGTYDLSAADASYTSDNGKKALLYVSGVLTGNMTIQIFNRQCFYRVVNATSGAFTVSVKTSAGSAKTITQGTAATLWCDGSNTINFVSAMVVPSTGAPAISSGAAASSVAVTAAGNLSSTNAQAAFSELQSDIDTINAALPNKQPLDTDLTTLAGLSNAKGNTIVGDGAAWSAVTVGSNGLVLRAASGQSSGVQWAAGAPSGTLALFQQTAAPTGWTKDTTHNNKALRVVSGTASSGGSTAFTSVFTSRTIAQANLPNVNFTVTDPGHVHATTKPATNGTNAGGGAGITSMGAYGDTTSATTGITVSSGGSGTAMDFAVQYVDIILASADA